MVNYKKILATCMVGTICVFTASGCSVPWKSNGNASNQEITASDQNSSYVVADSDLKLEFDQEDLVSDWKESECTVIRLADSNTEVKGTGVTLDASDLTITESGTYLISGSLSNGSIRVNVADKNTVRLIFNGIELSNQTKAPVIIEDAKKVIITLVDGTTNTITDSARATADAEDYSAAISSKADLVFNGSGKLTVNAGYRNGIKSSDDLKIVSGEFVVNSKKDGIIGKDLLGVKNGTFTIQAGSDGMKSTYDTDTSKGNVILLDGSYQIKAANDGIQAENSMLIAAGYYTIETANGAKEVTKAGNDTFGGRGMMFNGASQSQTTTTDNSNTDNSNTDDSTSDSYKGLKASNTIYINGGTYSLNCEDDGIHSNDSILIKNGTITIKSGDDGIHADNNLQIDDGTISVQQSYEGLEATLIQINGGELNIVSSDDGMNATDGSGSTGGGFNMGSPMNQNNNGQTDFNSSDKVNQNKNSQMNQNNTDQNSNDKSSNDTNSNVALVINGGNIFVNAGGDGLDANGSITINGGYTVVCGPTSDGDTAVDFDASCSLNGGTLMAFGSSGMLETPTEANNGSCIIAGFSSVAANTAFTLTDSDGHELMNFTPVKTYTCAILYSSDLKTGSSYTLTADGQTQIITVDQAITSNVSSGMNGGGMNGGGMKGGNMNGGNRGDKQNQNGNWGNSQMPDQSGDAGNGQMPDQSGNSGKMQPPDQNGDQGGMQMPDQNGNSGNTQMPGQNATQNNSNNSL